MTVSDQNIAIAQFCGKISPEDWEFIKSYTDDWWLEEDGKFRFRNGGKVDTLHSIPYYTTNLNAMHKAEKHLQHFGFYYDKLAEVMQVPRGSILLISASSSQRAEAFLKSLNLWKDN